jgi:hypothetical protein
MSNMANNSSFYKIYKLFDATPEMVAFKNQISNKLTYLHMSVVCHDFVVSIDENGKAWAKPRFSIPISSEDVKTIRIGNLSSFSSNDWFMSMDDFIRRHHCESIVDKYFGTKGFPTFNCKKQIAIDGRTKTRSTSHIDSYHEYCNRTYRDIFDTEIEAAKERVTNRIIEIMNSDEYYHNKRKFMEDKAVEEIMKVMKAYDHLGKEVLERALGEFVVCCVLDE